MARFYVRAERPANDLVGATQFYLAILEDSLGSTLPEKGEEFSNESREKVLARLLQLEQRGATSYPGGVAQAMKEAALATGGTNGILQAVAEELAAAWISRATKPSDEWNPPWFKIAGLAITTVIAAATSFVAVMQYGLAERLSSGIATMNSAVTSQNAQAVKKMRLEYAYSALTHLHRASSAVDLQDVKNGIVVAEYILTSDEADVDPAIRVMIAKGLCVLQESETNEEIIVKVKQTIDQLVSQNSARFGGCQRGNVVTVVPAASSASSAASEPPPLALHSNITVACKYPAGDTVARQVCRNAFDQMNAIRDDSWPVSFADPDEVRPGLFTVAEFQGRPLLRYFYKEDAAFAEQVANKVNSNANVGRPGVKPQSNQQYRSKYPRGFFELWVPASATPPK